MHQLASISTRRPTLTVLVLIILTLGFAASIGSIHKEFGYRVLLGGDHPAIERLEGVIERFGGGFPLFVVWRCGDGAPCDSVFDPASLEFAETLESALLGLAEVRRVVSPASAVLLLPDEDGFSALRFSDVDPSDAEAKADFVSRAVENPVWRGEILSPDGRTGAVVALLSDSRNSSSAAVTDAVMAAIEPFQRHGWAIQLAGEPIETVVAGRDLADSSAALTPLIAGIVAAIVLLLTRSWQGTFITMLSIGVSLLWTLGFHAWLGWPQDSIFEVLAPFVMTIGTCDAVHLLSQINNRISPGDNEADKRAAVVEAARDVGSACAMTTLTTATALVSFATSNLDTFVRFGITAAFGTLACFVLTFTLIPIFATRFHLPIRRDTTSGWPRVLAAVVGTAERRAIPILVLTAISVTICTIGLATRLRVATDIGEMYGDQNRVTRWTRFIERHLRGLESLEIDIGLPTEESILEPATHTQIAMIMDALEKHPALGRANSVQTVLGQLNRALHDDDRNYDRPADSLAGNAELFELIGFDSPEILDAWITRDRRHVRISVEAESDASTGPGNFVDEIHKIITGHAPADWSAVLTGSFVLDFEWVEEVQTTQVRSFATAFAIVLVLVTGFLRSIRLGLAAMLPAVLPVVWILGFMGWADLPLDVGRLMIAAIVIGIGVDDSIHLLSRYRILRAEGVSGPDAMRGALQRVGSALVITSFSLALGFVALTLSAWQTISSFGFFVSMAVLTSLLASIFVLPAVFFAAFSNSGK